LKLPQLNLVKHQEPTPAIGPLCFRQQNSLDPLLFFYNSHTEITRMKDSWHPPGPSDFVRSFANLSCHIVCVCSIDNGRHGTQHWQPTTTQTLLTNCTICWLLAPSHANELSFLGVPGFSSLALIKLLACIELKYSLVPTNTDRHTHTHTHTHTHNLLHEYTRWPNKSCTNWRFCL